jgi:hypothetical protein
MYIVDVCLTKSKNLRHLKGEWIQRKLVLFWKSRANLLTCAMLSKEHVNHVNLA